MFFEFIASALRTAEAILQGNFFQAVQQFLKRANEVDQSCAALRPIRSILAQATAGPSELQPEAAARIDDVLKAGGFIFSSYAATTQNMAFENFPSIADVILKRTSFGERLRTLRAKKKLTIPELLIALNKGEPTPQQGGVENHSRNTDASAKPSVNDAVLFSQWEMGVSIPSADQAEIVTVLDDFFAQDGRLHNLWSANRPRNVFEPYAVPWPEWDDDWQRSFHRMALYKTDNPEGFAESDLSSDRWNSSATEIFFRDFLEHFYGFLVNVKHVAREDISDTLLCFFPLVEAFFDFQRSRSGRTSHSSFPKIITTTLLNLYVYYLANLSHEASLNAHWQKKRKKEAQANGPVPPDWWEKQVKTAEMCARAFLAGTNFRKERLKTGASGLIEGGFGIGDVLRELKTRSEEQVPTLLLTPKAAMISRRISLALLNTVQVYRESTLIEIKADQVRVDDAGRIHLKIPKELFRGGTCGGGSAGEDGPLEAPEWAHAVIRQYLEQARPLLVGSDKDGGYFFTAGGGQKMSKHWIGADLRRTLGYRTTGARQLFEASSARTGMTAEDAALRLHVTPLTYKKGVERLNPEKTRKSNKVVESLLQKPKD